MCSIFSGQPSSTSLTSAHTTQETTAAVTSASTALNILQETTSLATTASTALPVSTQATYSAHWSWKTGPSLPVPLTEVSSALVGNWLYVFGSRDKGTYKIDTTNPSDGWKTAAPRIFHGDHVAVVVLNNKIWAFGGLLGTKWSAIMNRVQVYDPQTDTWKVKGKMPKSLGSAGAVLIQGSIYVCGGMFAPRVPGDGRCYMYPHALLCFIPIDVFHAS